MVVMSGSRMKLNPGEVSIDPLLEGVAWVRKEIGGRTYQALVDARCVKSQETLPCMPHQILHDEDKDQEGNHRVRISINKWTNWLIPQEDFLQVEWEERTKPVPSPSWPPLSGELVGRDGLAEEPAHIPSPMTKEDLLKSIQEATSIPDGIVRSIENSR